MSLDKIQFEKKDWAIPHLEAVAEDIATFLYHASPYILDIFVEFTRTSSGVSLKNYKNHIQKFFSPLVKGGSPDIIELKDYCVEFFSVCKNGGEIKKMRGLVPEKFFEKLFTKRHAGKQCKIEYGAKVIINGKEVIYAPENPFENAEDSDKKRQTVDAGFWDGSLGEFAEIKFQPEAYQTKEINYLRLLAKELAKNEISYQIFLVAFGNKDLIEKKLRRLDLFEQEQNEFLLIGKGELRQLEETA